MISKLCLLGRPRAWNSAGLELDWPKKAFLLLGRLAVATGASELSRAELAEFLWPDSAPEKARAALRTLLKRIREGAAAGRKDALRITADRIGLRLEHLNCDLTEALRDLESPEPAALARALTRLDEPFLAGFTTSEAPVRDWIEAQRRRLGELTAERARKALSARIYGADARFRENLARRVIDAEPLDDAARHALNKIERSQRRASRGAAAPASRLSPAASQPQRDKTPLSPLGPAPERRLVVKLAGPAPEAGGPASLPLVDSLLEEFERISGKPVFASAALGDHAAEHYTLTVDAQSLGVVMTLLKLTRPAGDIIWAGLISAEKAADPLERAQLVAVIVDALSREDGAPSDEAPDAASAPTAVNVAPAQAYRDFRRPGL